MLNTHEGTAVLTRMMAADEIIFVKEIAEICNSVNADKPLAWWVAHPTIVAEYEGGIIGYTSYAIAMISGHGEVLYGMDMCVLPQFRGRGIASGLHLARLSIGKVAGAKIFMGGTNDIGMAKILRRYGAHPCVSVPQGTLYVGEIKVDI